MTEAGAGGPSTSTGLHQPLFSSPLGLFKFQAEAAALTYWQLCETEEPVELVLYDTGIGKTVLSIASTCLMIEDDKIDHVVVVAEANKVNDWSRDDFPQFAPDVECVRYSGRTKAQREKICNDLPKVIVLSYETGRNDLCTFTSKTAIGGPEMLTKALTGKRVLLIFDEFSCLRGRTSKKYLAWDYLVNRVLRRTPFAPKVIGLTATTVEKDPEDHWNACRILSPERAGTVESFYANYVAGWDLHENPAVWKNLTPETIVNPGVIPLNQMFAPITIRKRKTDPDVIEQFPRKVENNPTMVELPPEHRAFYDQVDEIFSDPDLDEDTQRQAFGLLRQISNHPASLLRAQGRYARQIVEAVGQPYLLGLGSAKTEAMLDWQRSMGQQQTVIFTFFGQTVLPLLAESLTMAGYSVVLNHGQMSQDERSASQDAFKAGDAQIFLSSDAGARGLNLGVGSGLLHYEAPRFHSIYVQRSDRIHRINSVHPSVTIDLLIAKDTLEFNVAEKMLDRGTWAEQIHDANLDEVDGEHMSASERRAILRRLR